ncbi:MAG: hypothetical protein ACREBG_08490 [Pyrinomonadaceae bacterium]
MKRIILVVLLVGIAAVAGMVRSYSKAGHSIGELPQAISGDSNSQGEAREEIRKNYELSPGAKVEVVGINGAVKIETADVKTADVYIERTGKSPEALTRRKIVIESSPTSLKIRGTKGDAGFFARLFGSSPSERVTLRLPRQIALVTEGVNGSVTVGEIDGPVEVHGINGRVDVAQASGSAELHGINGNISLGLNRLDHDGLSINGVNGNIELRMSEGVNAEFEAHGMNGNVVSDLPGFVLERAKHGSYSGHLGSGGNSISAHGINGNIRLTRAMNASTTVDTTRTKS